ncbi:hypothetical protein NQ318_016614 [Aromia moschata]|uniref:Uncharacterized protein n=1 Tax=Aromia moschata TaxID=1265417 RepID=A0AAV8XLG4_9CUCU|nr:hypothetical protein NQ318_016614 [Aromia moschata]
MYTVPSRSKKIPFQKNVPNGTTHHKISYAVLQMFWKEKDFVQVAITVTELLRFHMPRSPLHSSSVSTVILVKSADPGGRP